jgi:branched-chain amino acid aminotransferase
MSPLGWLDGAGIFETIKTVGGKPWAFSRHMRRAVNAARREKILLPSEEVVRDSITLLLETEVHATGLLRVSFDATGNWAAAHLPYVEITEPARVRLHPKAVVTDGVPVKSYPYNHRLEILEQARTNGFDEALVTSSKGAICEGSVCNVLFKIAGKWCTPPLSDGVLPGVMRALVIENFDVMVRSIAIAEIAEIESGFLLSSLRIAQPIAAIDGRELSQSHEFRDEIEAMALRTSVG